MPNVEIKPTLLIDTFLLEQQRDTIARLVANLESGRTGIAIKRDLDSLLGIQGTLDAIGNHADRAASVDEDEIAGYAKQMVDGWDIETCMESATTSLYEFWCSPAGAADFEGYKEETILNDSFSHLDDYEGPECPGCTEPGNCDDCEYERDLDVDPVCERR